MMKHKISKFMGLVMDYIMSVLKMFSLNKPKCLA